MAFLLKYDSSLDFYLCKELIKSKTIVKKLFLKYCPCFLTNYQWSFCQMHLFIFHFYLLFCNWLSRPFFSPPAPLSALGLYYHGYLLFFLCLWAASSQTLTTHLFDPVCQHWHQPCITPCSLPSHLSYSCWSSSVILVSWSHPTSDGPQI